MTDHPGRWRWTTIWAEAAANVFGRYSRLRAATMFAVLAGAGLSASTAGDWTTLRANVQALDNQGWTTLIVTTGESATIDVRSCLAAADLEGVNSATAVVDSRIDQFVQLGTRSVPLVTIATTEPIRSIDLNRATTPYHTGLIGTGLLSTVADVRRLDTRTPGLPIRIVGLLPAHLDLADLAHSVVVMTPLTTHRGMARTCVFHLAASRVDELESEIPSALVIDTVDVSTYRPSGVIVPRHPYDDFLTRPQRFAPIVIGLLSGLVFAITSRSRASELGVYRLSGQTRIQLVMLVGAEQALISGFWLSSAATATLVVGWTIDVPLFASLGYQMWGIATMIALSLVVAAVAASRNVTDLLKDR